MSGELKCKKCGGKLEFDECFDTEWLGGEVFFIILGHCEKCGAEHSWHEVYKFSHYEELQLDE